MRALLILAAAVVAMPLSAAPRTAAEQGPLMLFRDPATGVISSEPAPGRVALGAFVSAERLAAGLAAAAALEARLEAVEARLARVESGGHGDRPVSGTPAGTVIAGGPATASWSAAGTQRRADSRVEPEPTADESAIEPMAGEQPPADRRGRTAAPVAAAAAPGDESGDRLEVRYARNAVRIGDHDDAFSASVQTRVQMRYATPFDTDPRSIADLARDQAGFQLRRSRLKVKGHVLDPDITWALQYDWNDAVLFDLWANFAFSDAVQLRLGRAKLLFNADYQTSSGALQFVERSIVHALFTADRQQGVQLHGRLFPDSLADLNYNVGLFTGRGMAERSNDDDRPMVSARLQWNLLGGPMAFSRSDLAFTESPQLSIAVAGLNNRSDCTAFATGEESCRALPGFGPQAAAAAGQYDVEQTMAELRIRWMGLSLDGELHRKDIEDRSRAMADPQRRVDLRGGFVQLGLLPHGLFPELPRQLEFALRYARVDPDDERSHDEQDEYSAAINWFIDGHSNKLSLDVAELSVADPILQSEASEQRVRLQWELSF